MRTYHAKEHEDALDSAGRTHPWISSIRSEEERYYDFVTHPELIPTSLEDFVPWSSYRAIQDFFDLLWWINGPESVFETNDCGFSGPHENGDEWVSKSVRVRGRVMMFFRRPELNVLTGVFDSLVIGLYQGLSSVDSSFELGVIGMARYPTYFQKANVLDFLKHGSVVTLYFWAWGDTNEEAMENLGRVLSNINNVVRELSRKFECLRDLNIETSMRSPFNQASRHHA